MDNLATIADTNAGIARAIRHVSRELVATHHGELSAAISLSDLLKILSELADAIDGGDSISQ